VAVELGQFIPVESVCNANFKTGQDDDVAATARTTFRDLMSERLMGQS